MNKEPTKCELINEILKLKPDLKKNRLWDLTTKEKLKRKLERLKNKEKQNENIRREI